MCPTVHCVPVVRVSSSARLYTSRMDLMSAQRGVATIRRIIHGRRQDGGRHEISPAKSFARMARQGRVPNDPLMVRTDRRSTDDSHTADCPCDAAHLVQRVLDTPSNSISLVSEVPYADDTDQVPNDGHHTRGTEVVGYNLPVCAAMCDVYRTPRSSVGRPCPMV